ncbi:MraY family glycosyltransferase [uncultured Bacteroides sp.]|uniref:MraY family glycosyltransferase n=1 Tax=uncultured Bacteroides sp. TaxID=162156 RepID=UPI002AABBCEE|nr:MraY family glycosyltransferase [uncultured Bacteroides sp.]
MGRIIIPYIFLIAFRKRLFDSIDVRKKHSGIIPRLGGVVFFPIQCYLLILSFFCVYKFGLASLCSNVYVVLPQFLLLICGLILLFTIGIADDLIGVNYRWKFVTQVIAASLFPISNLWINDLYGLLGVTTLPAWFGMPLTVFIVVFIINAVNLMDGIDGLCSGMIAIGCLFLGSLFIYNNAWLHAFLAFITTGILLPFFYYNVFGRSKGKRRIFMGDTGSLTLGLSISFLVISYAMSDTYIKPFSSDAIIVAFATLVVPMFDVIRVIFVRIKSHKSPFLPDRNHIHHKLMRLGISHHVTMILILLMVSFFCLLNIISVKYMDSNIVFLLDLSIWIIFNLCLDKIEEVKLIKMNKQKI